MNCIGSLFTWNKTFGYFDDLGKFQTTSLNVFQRALRAIGLMYAETRLATVSKIAQEKCFNPQFTWNEDQQKLALKILEKGTEKKLHAYTNLGQQQLDSGELVTYFGKIVPKEGYSFELTLHSPTARKREAYIHLSPTKEKSVLSIKSLYERTTTEKNKDEFMQDTDDCLARVTYLFLSKLLSESPSFSTFEMSHSSQNGNALMADKYGFTSKFTREYVPGIIVNPAGMTLSKAKASELTLQCGLKKNISIDFLSQSMIST